MSGSGGYPGVTVSAITQSSTPRLTATARREQLLDVALGVFARNGYHDTSMNDIADAAGVTKPVLYQHFDSKRELYQALLDDVSTRLLTAIVTAAAGATDGREQTERGLPGVLPVGRRGPRRVHAAVRRRHAAATTSSPTPCGRSPPGRPRRSPP